MVKLSPRLKRIAEEIEKGETMADIGTDHGFLPVYLIEEGISPSVILTDISPGSLEKGREDARMCRGTLEGMRFLLGDGISVLNPGEVDAVVIAGMGGLLMTSILGEDLERSRSFRKYILQPRNNAGRLRAWLRQNGFFIQKEQIVRERRHLCLIFTVTPGMRIDSRPFSIEDDYPDALLAYRDPLLGEYLKGEKDKYQKIACRIREEAVNRGELKKIENKINRLEYLLKEMI